MPSVILFIRCLKFGRVTDLGIFDNIHSEILVSDSQLSSRNTYDQYDDEEIATRFECKDFYKFEATFERISKAIQTGAFTKNNFSSVKDINIGSVFVLNGMLCYVADIYQAEARKNTRSQERLRLIFSNGTESNMLTHSLATAQYKYENSYQLLITDPDWMDDELAKNFGDNRQLTGVIYVAKLTDTPSNLAHYKHLHKIGFSTLTGEARTKHSIRDTAFLQQPVDIIAEWQVYDANARSVEGVLHAFFYDQRVKVSSKAANDNLYKATEWFNVPLDEIEKAINLVIAGDIKNYRMDGAAGKVVLK
ncbi:GIY-YIG nuclease family protein [Psychrobacter immobilis]|uniref:GIY-YIG nuclease family protein n=1 Tax=Psychrobacter immobilis TaxID=498 RepID=UPI001918E12A|nr:GIY-YIG nuclease family protein [Psychrobacter immobilis]